MGATETPECEPNRYGTLFYLPNIMDYSRIVVLIASVIIFRSYPFLALCSFVYVCISDSFDGWLARKLHQGSILGATLDIVVDRCFDALICMILGIIYPEYSIGFMLLTFLDLSSHWMRYTYYSRKHDSHKNVDGNTYRLLGLYYRSRGFLSTLCVAYEANLISLYVYRMIDCPFMTRLAILIICFSAPLAALKVLINGMQAIDAIVRLSKEPFC